ncbi:patatin-like phospholipase family protein [Paenibacillus agilis]|uniref:Patatin family protein n=1 Tax=Paenibacillus agilis TaxID=3020863 RepID=A0A559IGM1_9BACL|nr:patatin family protein [Paenibacillus agilis]TVX86802.1 patatin family protein [Paenibacillus agilis]
MSEHSVTVPKSGKTALVVEGGGMRGIFSTGVLDAFIQHSFNPFDICIGVSAGANNTAVYLGQMYKRNYKVITDYSIRPDFINWKKFMRGGHLMDLDWLWDTTTRELPVHRELLFNGHSQFLIGVTEVETGKPVYLEPNTNNLEQMLKASSAIPVLYRGFVEVDGIPYVDGGVTDSIPVLEAYRRGASTIMVIRSRPHAFTMRSSKVNYPTRWVLRRYPRLVDALDNRANKYQEAIDFMRNPLEDVRIIEVNPPAEFKTERLTRDIEVLNRDYMLGCTIGEQLVREWNG